MNSPLVSIVMSVYNSEKYIEECLNSILSQTYKNWELIIINDGSVDKSNKIITQFLCKIPNLVKYTDLDKNRGASYCLNLGISQSKGKYIARMDQDDIMFANRIEKQVNFLEKHTHISVLGSNAIEIDESGNEIGLFNVPLDDFNIKRQLILTCPIVDPSVMIKREIFTENVKYRNFPRAEDRDLWLRLSKSINFQNLNCQLVKKRTHCGQVTMSKNVHYDWLRVSIPYFLSNGILLQNLKYLIKPLFILLIPNFLYLYLRKTKKNKQLSNLHLIPFSFL